MQILCVVCDLEVKLAFHDADTDTNTDTDSDSPNTATILRPTHTDFLARMSTCRIP